MKIQIVPMAEVNKWLSGILSAGGNFSLMTLISLFGGDRASCCDEAAVVKEAGRIVAVASISPQGEVGDGVPTIVGLYVVPEYRRHGLGQQVFEAAIRRCQERRLTPIRVDALSVHVLAMVEKLPEEMKSLLAVNDYSQGLPPLD